MAVVVVGSGQCMQSWLPFLVHRVEPFDADTRSGAKSLIHDKYWGVLQCSHWGKIMQRRRGNIFWRSYYTSPFFESSSCR